MWGDVSGPHLGECNRWRHNFEDGVSRMVTSSWNPTMTHDVDVFLSTIPNNAKLDDLPVRVSIDPGDIDSISWNIFLAFQTSLRTKTYNDGVRNQLSSLSTFADDFPYTAFKIASFTDEGKNTIHTTSGWIALLGNNYHNLQADMFRMEYNKKEEDETNTHIGALKFFDFITDTSLNHFENNDAKRAVIIFAGDEPNLQSKDIPSLKKIRDNMIKKFIIPVFVVEKSIMESWQSIIDEIGFGAVVEASSSANGFANTIYRALAHIRGDVTIFPMEGSEGHLHMSDEDRTSGKYSIKRLKSGFRARFEVEMKGREVGETEPKTSVLLAPGFGQARIENVFNDRPVATAEPTVVRPEDDSEFLAQFGFNGTWIVLPGTRYLSFLPFIFFFNFFCVFSFQNEEEILTPVITKIPDRGTLYQWNETSQTVGNAIKKGDAVLDPTLRVVFHTPTDDFAKDGEIYTSFEYLIRDQCVASNPQNIDIYVTARNDAPWTTAFSPVGIEDEPITITLSGHDIEDDKLDAIVDRTPYEHNHASNQFQKIGDLYQWSTDFDPKNPGEPMKDGDRVTDSQKRVIYVAPPDTNTDIDTQTNFPEYFIRPFLLYHVVETETKERLSSPSKILSINIEAVNDAPLNWNAEKYPQWFSRINQTICLDKCMFKEDWDATWPSTLSSQTLWAGGHDIDDKKLDIIVTSLQCRDVEIIGRDGEKIPVAKIQRYSLPETSIGRRSLESILDIKPKYDAFGENMCILTYVLNDGELDSEPQTVFISFEAINDQPRMYDPEDRDGSVSLSLALSEQPDVKAMVVGDAVKARWVSLTEASPYQFIVKGFDPEEDEFEIQILSCFEERGRFTFKKEGDEEKEIECTQDPTNPFILPGKYSNVDEIAITFYPPDDATGSHFQEFVIDFYDGKDEGETIEHHIIFDVLDVNDPPQITYNDITSTQHNTSLSGHIDSKIILKIDNVTDSDIKLKQMEVEVKTLWGEIKVTVLDSSESLTFVEQSKNHIIFYGLVSEVRDMLSTMAYISEKPGIDELTIRISDQGATGKCPPDEEGVQAFPCVREAYITATITTIEPSSLNTTAVAGGAVLGVLILGLILFGVAWRQFRTPPADYVPWGFGEFFC